MVQRRAQSLGLGRRWRAHVLTPPPPPAEHRSSIHSCKPGRGVGLAQWLACGKPAPLLQAPRAVLPPQRGTAVLGTPWAGGLALPLLGPFLFLDLNVLLVKWVTTPDPRPGQLGSVANVTLRPKGLRFKSWSKAHASPVREATSPCLSHRTFLFLSSLPLSLNGKCEDS